jgi:hypothetical protein
MIHVCSQANTKDHTPDLSTRLCPIQIFTKACFPGSKYLQRARKFTVAIFMLPRLKWMVAQQVDLDLDPNLPGPLLHACFDASIADASWLAWCCTKYISTRCQEKWIRWHAFRFRVSFFLPCEEGAENLRVIEIHRHIRLESNTLSLVSPLSPFTS